MRKRTAAALIAAGTLALVSPRLSDMLTRWEGAAQNTVYSDMVGEPTVCRGLTRFSVDEPLIIGDYWSPEKCAEVEDKVVSGYQMGLAECLPDTINQKIFDAASDFGHALGVPNACAARWAGLLWAGKFRAACDAMAHSPSGKPVWSYVTKGEKRVFVRGLYNRRLDERRLCLEGAAELEAAR